jgi:hypothetical protein
MLDLRTIADALGGEVTGRQVLAPGPGHSGKDRSLSIKLSDQAPGGFLVHSFSDDDPIRCRDYVRQKLGLPPWQPGRNGKSHDGGGGTGSRGGCDRHETWDVREATVVYDYRNAEGMLVHQIARFEDGVGNKTFRQKWPDGNNGWVSKKPKGFRYVPYRLPELMDHDRTIPTLIVEGEKDVDNLRKIGITATTNAGGAGNWRPELNEYFRAFDVVIVPDNDDAGRKHAQRVAENLHLIAARVRIFDLGKHWKKCPEKGDISDCIGAGVRQQQLIDAIEKHAKPFKRATENGHDQTEGADRDENKASEKEIVLAGTQKGKDGGDTLWSWDNPDWTIIDDRRGELPEFPMEAMPAVCREWLDRASHGAGVTPAYVAVPLFCIASSLIGTARRVRPSRSWSVPLTMWTCIVGFSGSGKTPGLDVIKRALNRIETDRKPKIEEMRRTHETKDAVAKAARKIWNDDVRQAQIDGQPPPTMPPEAAEVEPFVIPRLYITDSTVERLAELLRSRPSGMLMIRDELAGLFSNMARYSGGEDNAFWLEAWNGNSYVVERMKRHLEVKHLLIGVTGGFQPDKLARSFQGDADGMYARFLIAWPEEAPYRQLSNEIDEWDPELINAICRLADVATDSEGFSARDIGFALDAYREFEQFRQFLHAGKQVLDGREREWWAKGDIHVLRLSGTLAFLAWAYRGGPEPTNIEAEFVCSAIHLWREYFWPHARAALRQIGISDRHANARSVLKGIRGHGKGQVSLRDMRRDALGQKLDAQGTLEVVQSLEKAGWLRNLETKSTLKGGRKPDRWEVNLLLLNGIAETAETAPTRSLSVAGWRSGSFCSSG